MVYKLKWMTNEEVIKNVELSIEYQTGDKLNRCAEYLMHFLDTLQYKRGAVVEFGVYKGATLAAIALWMKLQKIEGELIGLDTFCGFPEISTEDRGSKFKEMFGLGKISESHFLKHLQRLRVDKSLNYKQIFDQFHDATIEGVRRLFYDLELQSPTLIPGDFKITAPRLPEKIKLAFIDCDLYRGYLSAFESCYKRMVKGGIIVLDEYYSLKYPGARIATDSFFKDKPETPELFTVEEDGWERWCIRF